VDWSLLKGNISSDVAISQLIPVSYKWMSFLGFTNADFLCAFLGVCRPEDSKSQIRNWLYHTFNPNSLPHRGFLRQFTNAQLALIRDGGTAYFFITSFDIISDIVVTSYLKASRPTFPSYLFDFLKGISEMICREFPKSFCPEFVHFNTQFGNLMYLFFTISDAVEIISVIHLHIFGLLRLPVGSFRLGMSCLWSFLEPFADTTEFVVYFAEQLSFQAIGPACFSAYFPIVSALFLAFFQTLSSHDTTLINAAGVVFNRWSIALEDFLGRTTYRVAYALFRFSISFLHSGRPVPHIPINSLLFSFFLAIVLV
jgi:hypothetical protein